MKRTSLLIILIITLTIGLAGCSGKEPSSDGTIKANAAGKPANANVPSESPAQVTKNYLEAVRNRQYAQAREALSQRSIANLSDAASKANTNLDQALKRIIDSDAQGMATDKITGFETRNEDIRGDHATVEARGNNMPEFARISLVKEDGRWKISIDETTPGNPTN